jgi:hypothetical protein
MTKVIGADLIALPKFIGDAVVKRPECPVLASIALYALADILLCSRVIQARVPHPML